MIFIFIFIMMMMMMVMMMMTTTWLMMMTWLMMHLFLSTLVRAMVWYTVSSFTGPGPAVARCMTTNWRGGAWGGRLVHTVRLGVDN
jgi:hypothetical protein